MAQGIFVTGLNWRAGKTFAAAGIAANLVEKGLRVGVIKPIVSDCLKCSGKPYSIQAEMLKLAADNSDLPEITYPICLRNQGLLPQLFKAEDEEFNLDSIIKAFQNLKEKYEYIIAVGTGGLAEPINSNMDMSDIAKALELPIVFTLNPGMDNIQLLKMAVQFALAKGLTIAGYLINEIEKNTYTGISVDQAKLIEEFTGIKFLGWLPFSEGVNPVYGELGQLVENAASYIKIDELLK